MAAARARGLVLNQAEDFESSSGICVRGTVSRRQLALGNTALITQIGVAVEALTAPAESLRAEGVSVMFLAVEGKPTGILAVSDPIQATTAEALLALKASGLRVIMATGDRLITAKAVATKLGIDQVYGEVKPADKLTLVDKLQREGKLAS